METDSDGNAYVEVEYNDDGTLSAGLRQDGLWDMFFDLDADVHQELTKLASERDMTINELVTEILNNMMDEYEGLDEPSGIPAP